MAAIGSDRRGGPGWVRLYACLAGAALPLLASPASALPIVGTWQGGAGSWVDGSLWSFSSPPATATYPNNDATDFFTARIDGGKAGTDSAVSLAAPAQIDRLEIDAGDSLHLAAGGALTLVRNAARAGSGEIANAGSLALEGAGSQLRFDGDLALSGPGLLSLADGAGASVAPVSGTRTLFNNAGHRIEGAGSIQANRIENRGTIAATGASALVLSAPFLTNFSEGVIEARGAGGLSLTSSLSNLGTLRVLAGSRLVSTSSLNNSGVFRLQGAGAQASFASSLSNGSLVEVLDGARVTASGLSHSTGALTRIAGGGEISVSGGTLSSGTLELDAGSFASTGNITVSSSSTTLRGNGRIVMPGRTLTVSNNALLSPGFGGAGLLELDGTLNFLSGRLDAGLGGTALGTYDRLTVSGAAALAGGNISVSLLGGFSPVRGDVFDLITATTVTNTVPLLGGLISLPVLAGNLALVPQIASHGSTQSLRLATLESIEASWTGGSGSYTDPSRWSFSSPPVTAQFPSNDASNLFRVRIDGDPGVDSTASLASSVSIDRLEIGSGDALTLTGGNQLTLMSAPNRPGSGMLSNDGTLAVTGLIRSDGSLGFSGGGAVLLTDSAGNRITPLIPTGVTSPGFTNGTGHRIEGAGMINNWATFTNAGTIAAVGANPLTLALTSTSTTLTNSGTLEARGAGGLALSNPLSNTGTVRVLAGSRLVSTSSLTNSNPGGVFRVEGAGGQASFTSVSNLSLLEVRDGARLTTPALAHGSSLAVTRIANGGLIATTGSSTLSLGSGALELDGGTLSSAANLNLIGNATVLRGRGRLALPGRTLAVQNLALVSPGLEGTGVIEVDGALSFAGRLEAQLGGTGLGQHDRLAMSGAASITGGSMTVSLLEGYAPQRGDHFDLITGSTFTSSLPLSQLLSLPSLGGDLFLVPRVVGTGILRLNTAEAVEATWTGGAGDWVDPSRWSFSPAPAFALAPDNDDWNLFRVRIDGASGSDSAVSLGTDVSIDQLAIGAGDALTIGVNRTLTLESAPNRPGSGVIVNDGTLLLGGSGSLLRFSGNLALTGTGLLSLADGSSARLRNFGAHTLVNEAGHRIEGAGLIEANRLENRGTIAATGVNALTLTTPNLNPPTLLNLSGGSLEASGAGGLSLSSDLGNSGTVRVHSGSRLTSTARLLNQVTGVFRVGGAGSQATFGSSITNGGLLEVSDGGRLTTTVFSHEFLTTVRTRIASGGELVLTSGGSISRGAFELDSGTVSSAGNLSFTGSDLVLQGNGRILLPGRTLSVSGRLSPGLGGAGLLEIDGALSLSGVLAAELGGTNLGEYDRILVTGSTTLSSSDITVSLLDGYTPSLGDRFDLITASTLTSSGSLSDLFILPNLGSGLFLVPRIASNGATQSLTLGVMGGLEATWTGGVGDYTDPLGWSFDVPPVSAAFPSNDDLNVFRVRIDGAPGVDSTVSLATPVAIDRLEIASGDSLHVVGGADLTLVRDPQRVGSGELANSGTLALAGTGSDLLSDSELVFSGTGLLSLADGAGARVVAAAGAQPITNAAGHRIEGAGTIQANQLFNGGSIVATGENPLTLNTNPNALFSLENETGGVIEARGAGGVSLTGNLDNFGTVQVVSGSRLVSARHFNNATSGVLKAEGTGAEVTFLSLDNDGRIEVADGARISAETLGQHSAAAVTRIANGGELAISSGASASRGILELDEGTLSVSSGLILSGSSSAGATLRGSGRIELPGQTLDIRVNSFLAPGLGGAGLLEIEGALALSGRLTAELAGVGLGEYDRVVASGNASIGTTGRVVVSLVGGFAPARGEHFDLITAATLSSSVALPGLFTLPTLSGSLALVPEIASEGGTQRLRLAVLEGLEATWTGGNGDYTDPLGWTFSAPPGSAAFPNNDASNLFRVRIDGGSATNSSVSLAADVAIDRLEIGAGDALRLGDGHALTLNSAANRPGSGGLVNDGSLSLDGSAAGSQLLADGNLTLSGTGTLALSDHAQNRIAPTGGTPTFSNQAGHRIEGAGTIGGWSTFSNAGTIAATGANPLVLSPTGTFSNDGEFLAAGAGGLSLTRPVTNWGTIRVLPGSRLASTSSIVNNGSLEVQSGGHVSALNLHHEWTSDAITYIGSGSEIELTGTTSNNSIEIGALELDGGTLSSVSNVNISETDTELRGSGRISLPGRSLNIQSGARISPGLEGAGLLEVDGGFGLTGLLAADLGGTGLDAYDRISVSGSASIGTTGSIAVSLLEGFGAARGDRFDLIAASTLTSSRPLLDLVSLPTLGESLFLVPEIAIEAGSQRLRLSVLEGLEATWTGGAGSYSDPSRWSFSAPPASALFPSNDVSNLFQVRIDGAPGTESAVSLATDVSIDRLEIGAGDSLTLQDGSSLGIARAPNRPGSGEVANQGRLVLAGSGAGAELLGNGNLIVSGTGALVLSDSSVNRISPVAGTPTFTNQAGHRIEGAGAISGWSSLTNAGVIAATGANPLALSSTASLSNSGTLEAIGAGGFSLSRSLTNTGSVRVFPGSRFASTSGFTNEAAGVFLVGGADSRATFASSFVNRGRLDVVDGANLTASGLSHGTTATASTRIANGGQIFLTSPSSIGAGRIELDAGTLTSSSDVTVTGSGATLLGSGRIVLPLRSLSVLSNALVSPGLGGVGLLEVDGGFGFTGRLAAEIGGVGLGEYDRLAVSGAASISGGNIAVSLLGGFAPAFGDRFDLITAASVTSSALLRDLFSLPTLGGNLHLVPGISSSGTGQSLSLSVLEGIEATWTGGDGAYADPGRWSFSSAPISAAFPSNDASNLFRVRIDGSAGADSAVSLGTDVSIDRLQIGEGDALTVADGRALTLAWGSNRPGSGEIANDGLLTLGGTAAGARIRGDGHLVLSGSGTLGLSDSGLDTISPTVGTPNLTNQTGHRIEGAGTISGWSSLINAGTIAATGANPLVLNPAGSISNSGLLEARGAGGLSLSRTLSNTGTVHVLSGSQLVSTSGLTNQSAGVFRVEGAGSQVTLSSGISNGGLLEVLDGGRVTASTLSHPFGTIALTRIAGGGELALTNTSSNTVIRGVLELDSGTLSSAGNLNFFSPPGLLRGNGRIALPGRSLTVQGTGMLSPGLGGPGLLEVDGGLAFSGRLAAELGGTGLADYDRITVSGTASITGGDIEVSLLGGFAPERGDRFDLITASALTSSGALHNLFALPALGESLFLVPTIAHEGGTQSLRLGVLEGLEATWTGGAGDYADPAHWSFSAPTASVLFPSNDASNLFQVRIDAAPGTDSAVSLDTDVSIDRLEIGADDSLAIQDGASLDIAFGSNRPGSGEIANAGNLFLAGASELGFEGELTLSGGGTLELTQGTRIAHRPPESPVRFFPETAFINDTGHRIEGAGTIEADAIENRGTIVATGSDSLVLSSIFGDTLNDGVLEAIGSGGLSVAHRLGNTGAVRVLAGSHATLGWLTNLGSFEVLDGGRAEVERLSHADASALTRITNGSELVLTELGSIGAGVLELDAGSLTSTSSLFVDSSDATLRGNGRIVMPGRTLEIGDRALLSPGLGGAGLLELDGRLELYGDLSAELGGTGIGEYDRLTVTESASIFARDSVAVSLIDGFSPTLGDAFDLITAATLTSSAELDALLTQHQLGGDLFLVPEIATSPTSASLRVRVVEAIDAAWLGGSGSYSNPLQWSFDGPPVSSTIPNNDGSNLFRVSVGSSFAAAIEAAGTSSFVSLDQDVAIDRLAIGAGNTFSVTDGHTLTLAGGSSRVGSGVIMNDGTLSLDGDLEGASLAFTGDLSLTGIGTLALSDAPTNRVGASANPFTLANEAGHFIEGAGTLEAFRIENRGTVTATGANPLVLVADTILNQGLLDVIGAGGLDTLGTHLENQNRLRVLTGSSAAVGSLTNQGRIDVLGGGHLEASYFYNLSGAVSRIVGAESAFSAAETITNLGLFEVLDGARVTAWHLSHSTVDTALTRISGGAEMVLYPSPSVSASIAAGSLELDDGRLVTQAIVSVFTSGELLGNGQIETPLLRVSSGGRLVPGGALEVGHLEVVGDLDLLLDGVLDVDLGGVLDGQFDLITVTGSVELGGLVSVNLIDPASLVGGDAYLPALGDWFDVIVADSIVDTGASWALPDLGPDLFFVASIVDLAEQQALRLAIIPEPGTGALLALGLTALAARRRRIH